MSKKRRAKIPPFRVLNSENIFRKFVSKIMRSCDKNFAQLHQDTEFEKTLKENIEFMLKKLNVPISTDGFSIVPVKGKKVVQNVFGHMIDANIGIYKLKGTPELLNYLYQAGMGSRRSEGHGKFEIIM